MAKNSLTLFRLLTTFTLFIVISGLSGVTPVHAATTWTVTNANSSGSGSLRQAILDSGSGDVITFAPELSGATINFSETSITKDLIIDAMNLSSPLTLLAYSNRFFSITTGVTLELKGMILTKPDSNTSGGAIYNEGTLIISNCTISNNSNSGHGGAILSFGNLTVTSSNFLNNRSTSAHGGAIMVWDGEAIITNSTFVGNWAKYDGGTILSWAELTIINSTFYGTGTVQTAGGAFTVKNSTFWHDRLYRAEIIAYGNSSSGTNTSTLNITNSIIEDCDNNGAIVFSFENNLSIQESNCGTPTILANPILGLPINNGGPTQTMALFPDSPAIDAGEVSTCVSTDQRGIARPYGSSCDIGAYESSADSIPLQVTIIRPGASPTNASTVDFNVFFSESVTGVDASDFTLRTGGVTDASISTILGSGSMYIVTVDTGSGNGSIGLDLIDDDSITNGNGDILGGTGIGNGNFASPEVYSIRKAEINITGNGNSIPDDDLTPSGTDNTDFGNADVSGGTVDRTFIIENTGTAALDLSRSPKVSISGGNASDFSLTTDATSPVPAGGTTTFTVHFDPSAVGKRTTNINILSNDSDEEFYNFVIQGTGLGSEIHVAGNNNLTIYDGDSSPRTDDHTDFGSVAVVNGTVSHTFTIHNSGNDGLVLTDSPKVTINGTNASDFSVSVEPANPIAPAGSTTFTVVFDPGAIGLRTASISIANNDADENPYNFSIQGTGIIAPEIDVQGNNVPILDGDATPSIIDHTDFGSVDVANGTVEHTFNIENTGSTTLNLSGAPKIEIGGANAGDFSITVDPISPIPDGNSTTFTVRFGPSFAGTRTATLSIANNDSDENPYNFSIQGTGTTTSTPTVLSSLRAGASPTNTASVNFIVTFSEPVIGVDTGDFSLTTTGITGSSVASVTGSGTSYTVYVNTGSGSGTIRLNIPATATITNPMGGLLGGLPYTSGQSYTIDKTAPTVTSFYSQATNPTNTSNLKYSLYFSESVTGVDSGDFSLTTSGITDASVASITGSGSSYTVIVNTGSGNGTIRLDIPATATIVDGMGSPLSGLPYIKGVTYTIDKTDHSTDGALLDTSFGVTGKVVESFAVADERAAALQSDGKILMVGSSSGSPYPNIALVRFNSNGSVDTSFGTGGLVSTTVGGYGSYNYGNDVALQADGKIVVLAQTQFGNNTDITLARYNNDGSLDTTFGTNGIATNDLSKNEIGYAMGIQPDGKIVVAGDIRDQNYTTCDFLLMRYNSNGSLDTTFGTDGSVIADFGGKEQGGDIILQPDGKIVAIGTRELPPDPGTYYNDFALVRYNSDGSVDTSFGVNGLTIIDFGESETGYSGVLQPDGKIIVGGGSLDMPFTYTSDPNLDFILARYNSNGSLDESFGIGGKVITDIAKMDYNQRVALQSDGKIVTVGLADHNFLLARYNDNGSPDTTFGTNGLVITDFGNHDVNSDILIQPDGKILVTGCSWDSGGSGATNLLLARYHNGTIPDTTAPSIVSIQRADISPTSSSSINFTVRFSEPVTGVDASDFKLTTTLLTGASISGLTGTGAGPYTVTVNTGTGNGTIRLDIRNTASIQDLDGNAFAGPYTGGEVYTVSKGTAPTVPVLKSPANNALVNTFTPTLDWNDSSEVLTLAVPGWHYEINVASPYGYNETFTTVDDPDPLAGLGVSQYTFTMELPESTIFTWKVRAYNGQNQYSAWSASRTFRTPAASTIPAPPMLTSPADAVTLDNKRPTFSWDAVSGATSYTLQILSSGKVVNTGTIKAPLHSYTPAKDLLPDTTYTWRVKANGKVSSDYSAPFTFTTAPNPPKIPVLTLPANKALVDSAAVQILKWGAVPAIVTTSPATSYPAAASFEVEYATNNYFGSSVVEVVNGGIQLSLPAGTLLPNRTYYWRVRSWSEADAKGNHSYWSAVRSFRTKLETPVLNLPENNAVLDNKRPTFAWDEVPGAMGYTLQILKENPKTHLFTAVAHTYTIKAPAYVYTPLVDLLPNTVYTWKVKANGVNTGNFSAPFTFTTSPNPPKSPVLLAPVNAILVDSAAPQTLKWNPVLAVTTTSPLTTYPAAASYEVEYAMNGTFTGASDTFVVVNAPTTQTAPISLLPGRTYYWRVRSWSGADATGNHSAWSLVRMVKVKFVAPTLTSPALDVTGVVVRPTFTWNTNGNGLWTSYTLQVATNDKFTTGLRSFTIKAPVTRYTIPATLPALAPNTTYYWRVKINGLYVPITSSSQSFTTGP